MITKTRHIILFIGVALMALTSCQKVVVRVDSIPSNTPKGQPIYITGNFNNWDPGQERYLLQLNPDSTYSVALPPGFGTVEYKFTRGDWTTVEKDICGYEIGNRQLVLGEVDTVDNVIQSWNDLDPVDCPRLTLVVDSIPANTPKGDVIALAGNFNAWNPDAQAVLQKDSTGKYSVTIDRVPGIRELEFKITRGNLETSESDEFGNVIPNRSIRFGVKDTVKLAVEGWVDKPVEKNNSRVILIVKHLPKSTPKNDDLFLACNMNNWTPWDRNYIFQKNRNGDYFFPFPRKKKNLEFKVTRGSWATVEVDRFGYDIPNRTVNLETADTVYVNIGGWKDKSYPSDYELTLKIDKLPATTPPNPEIYLAGDINGWNTSRNKYRFRLADDGHYYLDIERAGHRMAYKITRGSWETAEVDKYGSDVDNRILSFQEADTIVIDIANWKDKPPYDLKEVTLVIDHLPKSTPPEDPIYLAPDFNGWDPRDDRLIFSYLPDGRPYMTLSTVNNSFEYKITRGGWDKVEVSEDGNPIPNRVLNYGFADTVHINIVRWRDFGGRY